MKGIKICKANIVNEDDRRKLIEIMNGQLNGKNIKILEVKEESYLGGTSGHWHLYPECMFIFKGKCWDYVMENIDTGEKILLKELIIEIGSISDRSEDTADRLNIMAVKRLI